MMIKEEVEQIKAKVGDELYCQLAEECTELAHAALKMKRAKSDVNPTPRTVEECQRNLVEELTDIILVAGILELDVDYQILKHKYNRWLNRLGIERK